MTWKYPGPGRPKLYNKRVTAGIDDDDYDFIKTYAASEGRKIADVVREFVVWGVETEKRANRGLST